MTNNKIKDDKDFQEQLLNKLDDIIYALQTLEKSNCVETRNLICLIKCGKPFSDCSKFCKLAGKE